ncbi:MAG: phosphoribosylamine--glycine ligase [Halobacteriovoraceae bacterium]|nr:phosphoribosylamine--glycine ligase [Halobacteriovoraceae bacterium]
MNVLVIGKGGREHAIAWKLSHSSLVEKLFVIPGNPGMALDPGIKCIEKDPSNFEDIYKFCRQNAISYVVIGAEKYLAEGLVDYLSKNKIKCIGPNKEGAQLETSKNFSKKIMFECDIPTAQYQYFEIFDEAKQFVEECSWSGIVVKADGLAAGKGVFVCDTKDEAIVALKKLMIENILGLEEPNKIILEEKLQGRELSAFALTDGVDFVYLGDACDYKRLKDNDKGPNTGGMGCYSPADWISNEDRQFIKIRIFENLFKRLKQRNIQFRGVLFAGLMKSDDGQIKVLEFNTRLGDPEAQVILPRLECDLAKVFHAAAHKKIELIKNQIHLGDMSACHVVKASRGYPGVDGETIEHDKEIVIEERFKIIENEKNKIFFAGVKKKDDKLVSTGGRVLGLTVLAKSRKEARDKIYKTINMIHFDGEQYREDIGI